MRTVIVVPAYNAEKTLRDTVEALYSYVEAPSDIIVCDDCSTDRTANIAALLPITFIRHPANCGYGGNQKTLYTAARALKPDAVIMIHGDNQYDAESIPAMIEQIAAGYDLVLGNRMETARKNGMPLWRYLSNKILSTFQNMVYRRSFSEYHSGMRGYSGRFIQKLPLTRLSNDFVFDTQVISWAVAKDYTISEVGVKCYYTANVSSINFKRSLQYGLLTVAAMAQFRLRKNGFLPEVLELQEAPNQ